VEQVWWTLRCANVPAFRSDRPSPTQRGMIAALGGAASSALWLRPFSITPPAPPSTGDCFVASLASALLPPSAAYWTGKMAQHHVVVLVPQSGGGWRAHFPDFPGCRAEAARVESTIDTSMRAVAEMIDNMHREGAIIPQPRSYEEVRADDAWAVDRGIDWSTAVISLVRV
jgi:predicted RNase H-like HicB family nuclease